MSTDEFPLLDVPELVLCLQECDFSAATLETITKPTSTTIIKLYQQIIDLFANINIDSQIKQVSIDEYNNENENTIPMTILNLTCYKFFQVMGINDFNLMDLCKPDFQRTKRILSAVVNYARFREERIFDCKESIQEMSHLSDILESKFDSFNLLRQQNNEIMIELGSLNGTNAQSAINDNEELNVEKLNLMSNDLEHQLKKLTEKQETLSLDYESYKLTKNDLLNQLENYGFQLIELESKRDKLIKISNTNITELNANIEQLKHTLTENESKLNDLLEKQTNLNVTLQTLEKIISEVYDLTNIISSDLKMSYGKEISIINMKKTLLEKRTTLNNVLNTTLSSQLKLAQEQLSRQEIIRSQLNEDMKLRIKENEEQITKLKDNYSIEIMNKLKDTENHINNDIMNKEIKSIELQIHQERQNFNNQLDELEEEYSLLIDHVREYMTTVLDNIN